MAINISKGTGRRKTAVARVYIREGIGNITINGKKADEYFKTEDYTNTMKKPLEVTHKLDCYDILISVKGGGLAGQADACKHGLSRALAVLDDDNHTILRKNGLLRRDSRMVERKKYGRAGARKKFQFSKR